MKKKIIICLVVVLLVVVACIILFSVNQKKENERYEQIKKDVRGRSNYIFNYNTDTI